MNDRSVGVLFAPALLCLSFAAPAQDLTNLFLKGPYLQGAGTGTMTIKWEAPVNKSAILHYGQQGQTDRELSLPAPRPLAAEAYVSVTNLTPNGPDITRALITNTVFLYEAALTGLQPGVTYTYSADIDGTRTPPKHFKTFALDQHKVTFVAYGDTRSIPKLHTAVAANFKRYSPDFILHMGDLVADGRKYELWGREFFGPLANVLDEIPLLPCLGNHEQDGSKYLAYMHLPGKELWYSYDLGPVHAIALDFQHEKDDDAQFAFAKRDLLNSKAPWKIAFLHYPIFNIGGHATGWGHSTYLPLFHQAKVDLVIAGHSHIYERFWPIAGKDGDAAWPITHITTGGGGAPLAASPGHPALAAHAATNHFVLIEATATTLRGRAITTNNTAIDDFELRKENGRPLPDILNHTYSEEGLELSFELPPSLTGALAAAPKTDATAPAMFTIRPVKSVPQPVELEIALTPDSAKYYKLEGGPVRTTTPTTSESNKVVWANVRAIGKNASDGLGSLLLTPPLAFQATAKFGNLETVAYGQRCRISEAVAEAAHVRQN